MHELKLKLALASVGPFDSTGLYDGAPNPCIYDTKFIICNAKFTIFNTKSIIFNAKFIIFIKSHHL